METDSDAELEESMDEENFVSLETIFLFLTSEASL